jgi:nucleotide-binding universal stress UspA family protein
LPGFDPTLAQVDAVAEAEKYLADLTPKLAGRGTRNIETHVWYGPPAASIIEAASVLGSVAESVLRGTRIPIFLRRPSGAPVDLPAVRTQPKEVPR